MVGSSVIVQTEAGLQVMPTHESSVQRMPPITRLDSAAVRHRIVSRFTWSPLRSPFAIALLFILVLLFILKSFFEVVSVEDQSNLRAACNHASSGDHDLNIRGSLVPFRPWARRNPAESRASTQAAGVVEGRQSRDCCETVARQPRPGRSGCGERGRYGVDAMTPKLSSVDTGSRPRCS